MRYDSGQGDDRILIFGCFELLDGLVRADVWLCDSIFKIVPDFFYQLNTFHFTFAPNVNSAAIYSLLLNKTASTYSKLLQQLAILIPTAAPRTILVDFERAAVNAFQTAYPDAAVSDCCLNK